MVQSGFKRQSYDPYKRMSVKFSDDRGLMEEALHFSGPCQEFLRLLMEALARSFEGREGHLNLALSASGTSSLLSCFIQCLAQWIISLCVLPILCSSMYLHVFFTYIKVSLIVSYGRNLFWIKSAISAAPHNNTKSTQQQHEAHNK